MACIYLINNCGLVRTFNFEITIAVLTDTLAKTHLVEQQTQSKQPLDYHLEHSSAFLGGLRSQGAL